MNISTFQVIKLSYKLKLHVWLKDFMKQYQRPIWINVKTSIEPKLAQIKAADFWI